MPHKISKDNRDKFVACLLGDELMTDKEFAEVFNSGHVMCGGWNCGFCYHETCAHPFRPGSLVDFIFADAFSGHDNAKELIDDEAAEALNSRKCCGCSDYFGGNVLDTAFRGIKMFYDWMFERDKYGYLCNIPDWDDFRKRGWGNYFDGVPLFKDGNEYGQYEDNIRKHFLDMMRSDYDKLVSVVSENKGRINSSEEINKCIAEIKYGLVMHFVNYWEKEEYKNA